MQENSLVAIIRKREHLNISISLVLGYPGIRQAPLSSIITGFTSLLFLQTFSFSGNRNEEKILVISLANKKLDKGGICLMIPSGNLPSNS